MPKGHAVTWWGLNWRMHAACGLLEIAHDVRDWSKQHRSGRDQLGAIDRGVERGLAALIYLWIETANPRALPTALGAIIQAVNASRAQAAKRNRQLTPAELPESESVENLVGGESFGQTLCAEARLRLEKAPGPAEQGYTARYRAHLWLDDIAMIYIATSNI